MAKRTEPNPELRQWRLDQQGHYRGRVWYHPDFPNAKEIVITEIKSVDKMLTCTLVEGWDKFTYVLPHTEELKD